MSNTKNPYIDEKGTKYWYDEKGNLHRKNGPAVLWSDGGEEWFHHGLRHREDGPAEIWSNGYEAWYRHSRRHREDGPAVVGDDGYETWYRHGKSYKPTDTELAKWELKRDLEAYEKQL